MNDREAARDEHGRPRPVNSRRRPTLPGALAPSTIGAEGLNFSVRYGKRCVPLAMTTGNLEKSRGARRRTLKTP
jgi:hypothetical protein